MNEFVLQIEKLFIFRI